LRRLKTVRGSKRAELQTLFAANRRLFRTLIDDRRARDALAALALGWRPTLRAAVTIGFIGGLTTYSSFNYETMRLFGEGAPTAAAANVVLTMVGGLIAGWLGLLTARELLGR
jgi:CrcB-like protein, Camphor Resistance (CrcB)